jgi:hypothetical protein
MSFDFLAAVQGTLAGPWPVAFRAVGGRRGRTAADERPTSAWRPLGPFRCHGSHKVTPCPSTVSQGGGVIRPTPMPDRETECSAWGAIRTPHYPINLKPTTCPRLPVVIPASMPDSRLTAAIADRPVSAIRRVKH